MFNSASDSRSYGVKYQARCVVSRAADTEHSQFLVGTLSLREENEVHVIQCDEHSTDITCEGLYAHQHEIWDLAACPFDSRLFSTVYAAGGEFYAAIWRLPERNAAASGSGQTLEQAAQLTGLDAPVKCVLWHPRGPQDKVVSVDEESLRVWHFEQAQSTAAVESQASAGELQQMGCGSWDPHDRNTVATASEGTVHYWDLRTMERIHSIEQAHLMQVRDMDFSPKHDHVLMTTGDDSRIRIWDRRNTAAPLVELPGHSHWTWRARFNPFFDELILSAGTDTVVNLWRVNSVGWALTRHGSSSYRALEAEEDAQGGAGGRAVPLQAYTEHEDSVYGIAWSAFEPWVFASVSYDGRVLVSVVPQAIRQQVRG